MSKWFWAALVIAAAQLAWSVPLDVAAPGFADELAETQTAWIGGDAKGFDRGDVDAAFALPTVPAADGRLEPPSWQEPRTEGRRFHGLCRARAPPVDSFR